MLKSTTTDPFALAAVGFWSQAIKIMKATPERMGQYATETISFDDEEAITLFEHAVLDELRDEALSLKGMFLEHHINVCFTNETFLRYMIVNYKEDYLTWMISENIFSLSTCFSDGTLIGDFMTAQAQQRQLEQQQLEQQRIEQQQMDQQQQLVQQRQLKAQREYEKLRQLEKQRKQQQRARQRQLEQQQLEQQQLEQQQLKQQQLEQQQLEQQQLKQQQLEQQQLEQQRQLERQLQQQLEQLHLQQQQLGELDRQQQELHPADDIEDVFNTSPLTAWSLSLTNSRQTSLNITPLTNSTPILDSQTLIKN